MKTNIKMRVTPEQSRKVQEICFENKIKWATSGKEFQRFYEWIYIDENYMYCFSSRIYEEIDADLFIRTNGTCEENAFNELFEKVNKRVNDFQIGNRIEPIDKYRELEQKLKKKNEILKKARIKRKNQREELQKCISLEEHHLKIKTVLNEKYYLEKENKSLKESSKISCNMLHSQKDTIVSLRDDVINKVDNMRDIKNKEIEKLKAVIEYLESKVK